MFHFRHAWLFLVFAGLLGNAIPLSAATPERNPKPGIFDPQPDSPEQTVQQLPIPIAADQAASEKLVHELFAEEYEDQTPLGRRTLSQHLLRQAASTEDDPTGRFSLLHESIAMSTESGDLETCLSAIRQTSRHFLVDGLQMDADAIVHFCTSSDPETRRAGIIAGLALADAAVAARRGEILPPIMAAIESAAERENNAAFVSDVRAKVAKFTRRREEQTQKAADTAASKKQSDDPAVNLLVGRSMCFDHGDWVQGLPYLAKGSDLKLKGLALKELGASQMGQDHADVADAWWEYLSLTPASPQLRAHCATCYTRALGETKGLRKALIRKRLSQLEELRPKAVASTMATAPTELPVGSIVFVCDASGSMLTKMVQQKDVIRAAVGRLRPEDRFNVLFFADQDSRPAQLSTTLIPATERNKSIFERFLADVRAAGNTDPLPAMRIAVQLRPAVIYFATDGDFEDNAKVLLTITSMVHGTNVRIDTVVFADPKNVDKGIVELMQKLAAETGGQYCLVNTNGP